MRSLFVVACLATLACGFIPAASAGVPSPPNATFPRCIGIMGHNAGGIPDPLSEFVVTFRDLANNPVTGAMVVIDFSACTELRLCSDDHNPNIFVDCPTRTVRSLTNANGVATFRVMGWSVATSGTPGSPYDSAKVFADGLLLGSSTVQIFDLDKNGLGAGDLGSWLGDFFSGNNPARGDYDCSGTLGAADLGEWLGRYFASGSTANCSPEGPCP